MGSECFPAFLPTVPGTSQQGTEGHRPRDGRNCTFVWSGQMDGYTLKPGLTPASLDLTLWGTGVRERRVEAGALPRLICQRHQGLKTQDWQDARNWSSESFHPRGVKGGSRPALLTSGRSSAGLASGRDDSTAVRGPESPGGGGVGTRPKPLSCTMGLSGPGTPSPSLATHTLPPKLEGLGP